MGRISSYIELLVDRAVSLIFSKEKFCARMLFLLVIIGFILRLFAAINLGVLADDSIYMAQSANIFSAKIISTHSHPALFFYLTDISYKILGYTTLASRLIPLLAGTLLIIIIFLIAKKLFDEKVALFAAFFATFSNFLIKMTFTEHSLFTFFMIFFGIYIGLFYLDTKNKKYLLLSAMLFGLACLSKYNGVFFLFAFLLFAFYHFKHNKSAVFTASNVKHFLLFILVILLFCLPFLSFNYLIYKQKGITDYQFSVIFKPEKSQELFGGLAGQDKTFFGSAFKLANYGNIALLYHTDLLMLLFGLAGFAIMFLRKEKYKLAFHLILLFVPFFLQSVSGPLPKHFAFIPLLFAIPAGYSLNELRKKLNKKYIFGCIIIVLTAAMIVNLGTDYGTPPSFFSKNSASELKSFINNNVKPNDLIVFDPRIYTAQAFWLGTPNNFVILPDFVKMYEYNVNISDEYKDPVKIYFIECASDDCGWGTIASQQEFNQSVESLLSQIKGEDSPVAVISDPKHKGNVFLTEASEIEQFKVYEKTANFNPSIIEQAYKFDNFYFVSYLYKDMSNYAFNYKTDTFIDRTLHKTSYLIIIFSIILAYLSFILAILFFIRDG